ncbi:hypothetical protein D3C76_1566640 [compost metagenome]
MVHRVEQPEGRNSRQGQRNNDPEQNPQVIAAVNFGGIFNAVGHLLEEVLEDNQVKRADCRRNHQGPERIDQMQGLHHIIGGDQPAVKQHGEQHRQQHHAPALEAFPGERIRQ